MTAHTEGDGDHPDGAAPLCSVVMPVYNTREALLRTAIESILNQSLRDFEFIIVDNGSGADTVAVLDSYNDARIRRLRIEENQGPASARNHGIDHARGEFIAFMDSDDISLPERLTKQVRYMREHPEVGCLGTDTKIIRNKKLSAWGYRVTRSSEIECSLMFVGCVLCQSSLMMRRSVLDNDNIRYKAEYVPAEDYELLLELIGKTRFFVLNETLTHYRFHPNNMSSTHRTLQKDNANTAQRCAIERHIDIKSEDKELLLKCIQGSLITNDDLILLPGALERTIQAVEQTTGLAHQDIMRALRMSVRKLFYHTRTLRGQWALMRSQLHRMFHLSFSWRLWCFVTRGFF